jgi:translation initiation factor IF-1
MVLPPDQKPATVTVSATVPGRRKKTQSKIKVTPGQVVTLPTFDFTQ